MNIHYYSRFVAITFLSFAGITLYAQENNVYEQMLKQSFKESLKSDFFLNPSLMRLDSSFYKEPLILDVNKNPLDILGYDRELNALFRNFKDSIKIPDPAVASYLTTSYTDWYKYDPNATETDGEVISNVVLVPVMSVLSLNFISLFDYFIRAGVIPYDDPVRSRKKERFVTPVKYTYSEKDKMFIIDKTNQMIWEVKTEEWNKEETEENEE